MGLIIRLLGEKGMGAAVRHSATMAAEGRSALPAAWDGNYGLGASMCVPKPHLGLFPARSAVLTWPHAQRPRR